MPTTLAGTSRGRLTSPARVPRQVPTTTRVSAHDTAPWHAQMPVDTAIGARDQRPPSDPARMPVSAQRPDGPRTCWMMLERAGTL